MSLQEQLEALAPYSAARSFQLVLSVEQDIDRHVARVDRWRERTASIIEAEYGRAERLRFESLGASGRFKITKDALSVLDFIQQAGPFLQELIADSEKHGTAEVNEEMTRTGSQVFLVHGHDEAAKLKVALFFEQLPGLELTILDEKPHRGRTLRQKLEDHAKADFAVVLLTPDDEGNATGKLAQPRARQNVILELGYFWGKYGFDRVCVLLSDETIERPSDLDGTGWHLLDEYGGWRDKLRQELIVAKVLTG